jgi:hypothetical protein
LRKWVFEISSLAIPNDFLSKILWDAMQTAPVKIPNHREAVRVTSLACFRHQCKILRNVQGKAIVTSHKISCQADILRRLEPQLCSPSCAGLSRASAFRVERAFRDDRRE